jgi:dipeptidyl aminopeptidase/acylaminoacyl peptidase
MGLNSSEGAMGAQFYSFLPRTGRAVLYPVYKGTFERRSAEGSEGPNAFRDAIVYYAKDLSRSIDYLESRQDIQSGNLAYYGLSTGGFFGPIFLAVEPRFKAAILVAGGLFKDAVPAEVDSLNFAPRVRTPVLLLNGRYDFYDPPEMQQALYRSLGTAVADKRYVLSESGHVPPMQDLMREVLTWLDTYLGPVRR